MSNVVEDGLRTLSVRQPGSNERKLGGRDPATHCLRLSCTE